MGLVRSPRTRAAGTPNSCPFSVLPQRGPPPMRRLRYAVPEEFVRPRRSSRSRNATIPLLGRRVFLLEEPRDRDRTRVETYAPAIASSRSIRPKRMTDSNSTSTKRQARRSGSEAQGTRPKSSRPLSSGRSRTLYMVEPHMKLQRVCRERRSNSHPRHAPLSRGTSSAALAPGTNMTSTRRG